MPRKSITNEKPNGVPDRIGTIQWIGGSAVHANQNKLIGRSHAMTVRCRRRVSGSSFPVGEDESFLAYWWSRNGEQAVARSMPMPTPRNDRPEIAKLHPRSWTKTIGYAEKSRNNTPYVKAISVERASRIGSLASIFHGLAKSLMRPRFTGSLIHFSLC